MKKQELLNSIRAANFAMLEAGLFLDTNPMDSAALKQFEVYRLRYKEYVKEYEKEYGPITLCGDFGGNGFEWINNPWPWEKEAN